MLKIKSLLIGLGVSLTLAVNAKPLEIPTTKDLKTARLSSLDCLAVNAYHEGRSQSDIANLMIMATVVNRVNDNRYPNDICKVVFKRASYSWTSDGLSDEIKDKVQYKRLYKLAEDFIINKGYVLKLSQGVDHYHKYTVLPYWAKSDKLKYVMIVDDHVFYKWVK